MPSKNVLALSLVLALASPLAACGGASRQPSQSAGASGAISDAEIAAVLEVINRAEIQQAELANERAEAAEVRGFAASQLTDHRAAVERQDAILQERGIPTRDNPTSRDLELRSAETRDLLADLDGADFDRAYLDAQLRQHRRLIAMLDEELIPAARDPQYRVFLAQQRGELARHLQAVEQLRTRASS
jgi:putative membrane protein